MDLALDTGLVKALGFRFDETGPDRVRKGGIVRDEAVRAEVCDTIRDWLAALPGWTVHVLGRP